MSVLLAIEEKSNVSSCQTSYSYACSLTTWPCQELPPLLPSWSLSHKILDWVTASEGVGTYTFKVNTFFVLRSYFTEVSVLKSNWIFEYWPPSSEYSKTLAEVLIPPGAGLSKDVFITFASAFHVMFPLPSKSSEGSVDATAAAW